MTDEKKAPQEGKPAPKSRRQYTAEQKAALLDEADKPGESIALVARRHGLSPSIMFRWRQLRENGAATGLKADEELVPASEMRAARAKIRELQRLLGKKTEENEILHDALEIAHEKKLISRLPSLPRRGGK
jgi:transposase